MGVLKKLEAHPQIIMLNPQTADWPYLLLSLFCGLGFSLFALFSLFFILCLFTIRRGMDSPSVFRQDAARRQ